MKQKQWVVKVGGVSKSVYEHCNDRHQKREDRNKRSERRNAGKWSRRQNRSSYAGNSGKQSTETV